MDIRQIREQFGRVKPYYLKNETLRAMGALMLGLKGAVSLPGGLPTDLRGLLREAVQILQRDETVKKMAVTQLAYQPGQERLLLTQLADLYKKVSEEMDREDYDVAAARKLHLDQALNQGLRSLEAGRLSEADQYFQEAVSFYKNEHRVFFYIGKNLVDAGACKRALTYLRRGLEVSPSDMEMANLLEQAMAASATESDKAESRDA